MAGEAASAACRDDVIDGVDAWLLQKDTPKAPPSLLFRSCVLGDARGRPPRVEARPNSSRGEVHGAPRGEERAKGSRGEAHFTPLSEAGDRTSGEASAKVSSRGETSCTFSCEAPTRSLSGAGRGNDLGDTRGTSAGQSRSSSQRVRA